MIHNNGHDDDPREPTTPFDEATDLIDETGGDDLVKINRMRMPPLMSLVVLGAILVSPLFGLVFGLDFALAVLVVAMAVTTWIAWDGSKRLVPAQAAQLRKAAMLNAVVAVIVLLLLVMRLIA
jgi:hypothetical protein